MNDVTELDELQSGLTSGFWQRFRKHAEQEWGTAGETYQAAIRNAVQGPAGNEAEAVQRLKAVAMTQAAVIRLLGWPDERVAQIKKRVETDKLAMGPSRRGPGL